MGARGPALGDVKRCDGECGVEEDCQHCNYSTIGSTLICSFGNVKHDKK